MIEEGLETEKSADESARMLVNRLGSRNKLSLQEKLRNLVKKIPGRDLMPLLDNPDDPEKAVLRFVKGGAKKRNFLTHYSGNLADKIMTHHEMRHATASCWAGLTYWLAIQRGSARRWLETWHTRQRRPPS